MGNISRKSKKKLTKVINANCHRVTRFGEQSQYTNIPDGVMTTCPHCGNVTIVRETNY